jgi:formylglycine-generating enzyme required for sulfatase activity
MDPLIFRADRTGFPMVYIDELDAYLHWVPVTKLQFEQYLCAEPEGQHNGPWYDQVLRLNPRVAPDRVGHGNYWQSFVTGVVPDEAQAFARWCGEGYSVPTLDEWFVAYSLLRALPPTSIQGPESFSRAGAQLSARAYTLLSRLEAASSRACVQVNYERTTAHQMFLRLGVMEWVELNDQRSRWGGMGETTAQFHGNLFTPDHKQPSRPHQPESQRLHYFGFRLLWRA